MEKNQNENSKNKKKGLLKPEKKGANWGKSYDKST